MRIVRFIRNARSRSHNCDQGLDSDDLSFSDAHNRLWRPDTPPKLRRSVALGRHS